MMHLAQLTEHILLQGLESQCSLAWWCDDLYYKVQGQSVGSSLVEEDKLDLGTSLIEKAKAKGISLLLPTYVVIADKFAADANSKAIAKKLAELSGKGVTTIIGGDSVAAAEKAGLADKMSHISPGGGASL